MNFAYTKAIKTTTLALKNWSWKYDFRTEILHRNTGKARVKILLNKQLLVKIIIKRKWDRKKTLETLENSVTGVRVIEVQLNNVDVARICYVDL